MQLERVGKSKKLLLVAIVLGLLAAAMNWASSSRTSNLTVYKAKKQILAGTLATESLFDRVTISGELKEMRNIVVDVNDFPKAFKNRPLAETLEPGQLLMLRSFDISGEDVRESIKPGQRAISLDVADESQAVSYFVRPGDGVDVWGVFTGSAELLKEGACVRAVGEANGGGGGGEGQGRYRTITLVVSDADVRGLVSNIGLAKNNVKLSLLGPCDPKLEKPALKAIDVPAPNRAAGAKAQPGATPAPSDAAQPPAGAEPVPTPARKM
jgi:Flp pilus assembly protein CpaB